MRLHFIRTYEDSSDTTIAGRVVFQVLTKLELEKNDGYLWERYGAVALEELLGIPFYGSDEYRAIVGPKGTAFTFDDADDALEFIKDTKQFAADVVEYWKRAEVFPGRSN